MLKKEYKYQAPPAAAAETPDADGITDSMLDFSWERDVVASVSSIHCELYGSLMLIVQEHKN